MCWPWSCNASLPSAWRSSPQRLYYAAVHRPATARPAVHRPCTDRPATDLPYTVVHWDRSATLPYTVGTNVNPYVIGALCQTVPNRGLLVIGLAVHRRTVARRTEVDRYATPWYIGQSVQLGPIRA